MTLEALLASMLPFVGALAKWALVSAEDFANRFRDPLLRRALSHVEAAYA